jgi:hypothetical protein
MANGPAKGLAPPIPLRLLAFEADLRRLPRPFLDPLWAGVDALEGELVSVLDGLAAGPYK